MYMQFEEAGLIRGTEEYPNMEDEFWLWVSSWALFITKPSDINPAYSDEGWVTWNI